MITFTIPGEPQGKARARVVRMGNFTRTYTPEKTVNYENLIKYTYMNDTFNILNTEPLKMTIIAYYSIPKSTSKKKTTEMLEGKLRPTKKPDFENVAKVVSDALNKIAYNDDTQIVEALF
jgi:Holliday junction resolvase RusA-like endonuclease